MFDLDSAVSGALHILIWSSADSDGLPFDSNLIDAEFDAVSVAWLREELRVFLSLVGDDSAGVEPVWLGQQFVLSRKVNETFFRSLDERQGDRLWLACRDLPVISVTLAPSGAFTITNAGGELS